MWSSGLSWQTAGRCCPRKRASTTSGSLPRRRAPGDAIPGPRSRRREHRRAFIVIRTRQAQRRALHHQGRRPRRPASRHARLAPAWPFQPGHPRRQRDLGILPVGWRSLATEGGAMTSLALISVVNHAHAASGRHASSPPQWGHFPLSLRRCNSSLNPAARIPAGSAKRPIPSTAITEASVFPNGVTGKTSP